MKDNNRCETFPPLEAPTDTLIASGGDDRLDVDLENGYNNYGCSSVPGFRLSYSYSTASSISTAAFSHVSAMHRGLQQSAKADDLRTIYFNKHNEFRRRLLNVLNLPPAVRVVFGPSGTDLELAVLALAGFSRERKVHNIVLGVDEVGSGIRYVAQGKYCKSQTVMGTQVKVGEMVPGFLEEDISLSEVSVRSDAGNPRTSKEVLDDLVAQVDFALGRNMRPLIHIVHRSKTGLILPDWDDVKEALESKRGQVDLVVDACQGRTSKDVLANYLSWGALVLFTGSKFFGGAPFSGALLIPDSYDARIKGKMLPGGLAEFFTKAEWPDCYQSEASILSEALNFGLVLRWESALYEMERFFGIPSSRVAKVVDAFQNAVAWMCETYLFIKQVAPAVPAVKTASGPSDPLEREMIYTVELRDINNVDPLTSDDARRIYKYLYSCFESEECEEEDRETLKTVVHLGQPVNCYPFGNDDWRATLRISLGAPIISDIAFLDASSIEQRFKADMSLIAKKVSLGIHYLKKF
ncbi:hypothetical protein [Alloalcanivorax venustensis]|uniref:hypothetical protein n=1 Tax=Alloalcanivorax venustensis TaxID=172371 RepID=UPI001890E253|nr:hypothetical protein [Alloalcanivorax venustensis]